MHDEYQHGRPRRGWGPRRHPASDACERASVMEFRRITSLPPYALGVIDALKNEARRAGADVIDLAFGNPDIPSPDIAVEKLAEAVYNPRNHRYSSRQGIPKMR